MTELIQHVKRFRRNGVSAIHMHKPAGYPVYHTLHLKKKKIISPLYITLFSLSTYLPISLVELCNYGGVDYKSSDGWCQRMMKSCHPDALHP